ncbi:MAG: hypothetical protein HDT43_10275 [Ruminococcaceae bacterium]|nr:hypothetical protein [Oscillospiraceae bacterium]
MKLLKNIFLFIFKVVLIAALLVGSVIFWGFTVFIQTPGSLFHSEPMPVYRVIFDLVFLLPLNIALIVLAAVLLSRIGAEKNAPQKGFWRKAAQPAAIIVSSIALCSLYFLKDTIEYKATDILVNVYVGQADEIISYENSGDVNERLFDTQIKRSSVLLDYDRMTATFLYRLSWDHYKRVELFENAFVPDESHILQFRNPLKDGGELKVYYDMYNGDSLRPSIRSCAVTVERDGKIFGAHFEPEQMDFESCMERVYALEDSGLEALKYHENEMLPYTGGIQSDTVFIDYDNKKLHFVYLDASGFGVRRACCDEFDLTETDKVENVFLQAEYTLKNGAKLYAYGRENYTKYAGDPIMNWETEKTDGMVLEYGGKLYVTEINSLNRYRFDFLHSTGAVKVCRGWSIG